MDVSVIIPAYRASKTIARAVESVMRQTVPPSQIIIVADDGEDYADILNAQAVASPSLKFLSTGAVATGAGNTRNIGINAASGDCIALLDADDVFHPERLERVLPLVRNYGVAHTQVNRIDAQHRPLQNINHAPMVDRLDASTLSLTGLHGFGGMVFDRKRCPVLFDEHRQLEDILFAFSFFDYVEHIGYSALPLYDYYLMPTSVCNEPGSEMAFLSAIERFLDPASPIHSRIARYRAYPALRQHLECIYDAEKEYMAREDAAQTFQHYFLAKARERFIAA